MPLQLGKVKWLNAVGFLLTTIEYIHVCILYILYYIMLQPAALTPFLVLEGTVGVRYNRQFCKCLSPCMAS